ncbi:NAD(+) diphosphatase [Nanchangia anserum]|nr:NAD(+) diphosphatase [Nanchangia anserum]QOX81201.1 NAD(+) diphosphatase [Nanchangia anserum]
MLGLDAGRLVVGIVLDEREAAALVPEQGAPAEEAWPAWRPLREAGELEGADATAASHAFALAHWWANSHHCARCGGASVPSAGGWEQRCTGCERIEYPRQDPSVIVAITDERDRLLLAHNVMWRPRSMSLIAGYIEAGEAVERGVEREVAEETGLSVSDITYVASQAWPFPRSLMLGFRARTRGGELRLADGELDRAAFFTRDDYDRACMSGEVTPPGPTAIAATLIEDWLGHPLRRPTHVAPW